MNHLAYRLWTPEEDALIRERWASEHAGLIARRLNRTLAATENRARKLGLQRRPAKTS